MYRSFNHKNIKTKNTLRTLIRRILGGLMEDCLFTYIIIVHRVIIIIIIVTEEYIKKNAKNNGAFKIHILAIES